MKVSIWFELKTELSPVKIEKEITIKQPDGSEPPHGVVVDVINDSLDRLIAQNVNRGFEIVGEA